MKSEILDWFKDKLPSVQTLVFRYVDEGLQESLGEKPGEKPGLNMSDPLWTYKKLNNDVHEFRMV